MIHFHQGSLLDLEVDAIVNAANSSLMGGGGIDGVIHRAAGPELKEACRPLAPCPPGEVRVTEGFGLAPRLIFHTVGPIWRGGDRGEAELLRSCYEVCLAEAKARGLQSIAFPAISTGAYGFPIEQAAKIAVETCTRIAEESELDIWLVAIDRKNIKALSAALDEANP